MASKAEALHELIQVARLERVDAVGELERLEKQVEEARLRVAALSQDEDTLRRMHRRWFPDVDDDAEHAETGSTVLAVGGTLDWIGMSRSAAVEMAIKLINAKRPTVSPGDIEDYLSKAGRDDDRDEIGGVTAYLNRSNKIHSVGRGKWVYGPDLNSGDAAPTASPDSVPTQQPGGDGHAAGPEKDSPDHDPTLEGRDDRDHHRVAGAE